MTPDILTDLRHAEHQVAKELHLRALLSDILCAGLKLVDLFDPYGTYPGTQRYLEIAERVENELEGVDQP